MATYPVTIYRWDDASAPQITDGLPSEYLEVFNKCLVDGYGAKPSLGWTRPFHNGTSHISVFRNNTSAGGSGGCVRFNREGSDVPYGIVRLTHAVDMTAISTYVKRGFTGAFNTLQGASSGYSPIKWILIGTSIGFYFFAADDTVPTKQANFTVNVGFYAGDYFSTIPADAGRFIASASAQGDFSTSGWNDGIHYVLYSTGIGQSVSESLKIYSADNHNSSATYGYMCGFASADTGSASGASHLNTPPLNPNLFCPMMITYSSQKPGNNTLNDRLGVSINNSNITPIMRGIMPGVVIAYYPTYRDNDWGEVVTIASKNYYPACNNTSGGTNFFIELGEWHDPFN
jgi:hypothetical protein